MRSKNLATAPGEIHYSVQAFRKSSYFCNFRTYIAFFRSDLLAKVRKDSKGINALVNETYSYPSNSPAMPWLGGSPNLPPTISISNNIVNFQFSDDNLRYVTVYENGNLVDRIGDIHAPYTIPEHLQKKNVSNLL